MVSGNRVLVGYIGSVRGNTGRQCVHEWETQECRNWRKQEKRLILIENTGLGLDNILSLSMEWKFWESWMLCGSDSSGFHDSRLAGVFQQVSHECYGM